VLFVCEPWKKRKIKQKLDRSEGIIISFYVGILLAFIKKVHSEMYIKKTPRLSVS
jgi:hypothetical protein